MALQDADVIVIGHADAGTRETIVSCSTGRRIVDLSGYAELSNVSSAEYEGICW
jgi:GDP-mannose 6-dehydrogenase